MEDIDCIISNNINVQFNALIYLKLFHSLNSASEMIFLKEISFFYMIYFQILDEIIVKPNF